MFKCANALPKEDRIPRRAHNVASDALHLRVDHLQSNLAVLEIGLDALLYAL